MNRRADPAACRWIDAHADAILALAAADLGRTSVILVELAVLAIEERDLPWSLTVETVRRALEARPLPPEPSALLRVRLGVALACTGAIDAAVAVLRQAVADAERTADLDLQGFVLAELAVATALTAARDEAPLLARRAVALASAGGDLDTHGRALCALFTARRACAWVDPTPLDQATALPLGPYSCVRRAVRAKLATVWDDQGLVTVAEAAYRDWLVDHGDDAPRVQVAEVEAELGRLLMNAGRFEEAERSFEEGSERLRQAGSAAVGWMRLPLARTWIALGRIEDAEREIRRIVDGGDRTPLPHVLLGLAALRTGDPALAVHRFEGAGADPLGSSFAAMAHAQLDLLDRAEACVSRIPIRSGEVAVAVQLANAWIHFTRTNDRTVFDPLHDGPGDRVAAPVHRLAEATWLVPDEGRRLRYRPLPPLAAVD